MVGATVCSKYLRVQNGCRRTPSATSAASFNIAGPTAARVMGGSGSVLLSGLKLGGMSVKR